MEKQRVLLIAGGGAIGTYVGENLLKRGFKVDVVCLEDHVSTHEDLTFYKERVTEDYLTRTLPEKKYDAIVDFIHYSDPADYEKRHKLLLENTKHLIFLSSYRVYADETPVRETSPQLLDASDDQVLLTQEKYGISKAYEERILRASPLKNWTIVRPVISFSHFRFDLITQQASTLLTRAKEGKKILLPIEAKHLTAGIDWAGNVGKIIAHLVLNEKAYGEAYTISSAQNRSWEEVAGYYTEIIGAQFVWVSAADYLHTATPGEIVDEWALRYDRLLDRTIDNRKVLAATGLTEADFTSVRDALKLEIEALPENPVFTERLSPEENRRSNEKIDAYLQAHNL